MEHLARRFGMLVGVLAASSLATLTPKRSLLSHCLDSTHAQGCSPSWAWNTRWVAGIGECSRARWIIGNDLGFEPIPQCMDGRRE